MNNQTGQISSTSSGRSKWVKTHLSFDNGCMIEVHLTNRGKLNIYHYDQSGKLIQRQTTIFSIQDETIETKLTNK